MSETHDAQVEVEAIVWTIPFTDKARNQKKECKDGKESFEFIGYDLQIFVCCQSNDIHTSF